jgi:predicted esterase
LSDLVAHVEEAGVPAARIFLGGFSQGACLTAEFSARQARRYAGLLLFSGGLIGPPGTPRDYGKHLDGTPVFIGCSDIDPHVPLARVEETAAVLEQLGARVTKKIYPQMGHTIVQDELDQANEILKGAWL